MSIRAPRYRRPKNIWWDEEFEASLEIQLDDLSQPFDWESIFGNSNPVQVEIGFGKGRFILESAERHPDQNYFGIEWAGACVGVARERLAKKQIGNARLMRADAKEVIQSYILPNSVLACHLYFPDPWPKKRHHKRRMVSEELVASLFTSLKPDGEFRFFTDHREYFASTSPIVDDHPESERLPSPNPDDPLYVITNYEAKWRGEKREIDRGRWARRVVMSGDQT